MLLPDQSAPEVEQEQLSSESSSVVKTVAQELQYQQTDASSGVPTQVIKKMQKTNYQVIGQHIRIREPKRLRMERPRDHAAASTALAPASPLVDSTALAFASASGDSLQQPDPATLVTTTADQLAQSLHAAQQAQVSEERRFWEGQMTQMIARLQAVELENREMREAYSQREVGFQQTAQQYRQEATMVADQFQAAAASANAQATARADTAERRAV